MGLKCIPKPAVASAVFEHIQETDDAGGDVEGKGEGPACPYALALPEAEARKGARKTYSATRAYVLTGASKSGSRTNGSTKCPQLHADVG